MHFNSFELADKVGQRYRVFPAQHTPPANAVRGNFTDFAMAYQFLSKISLTIPWQKLLQYVSNEHTAPGLSAKQAVDRLCRLMVMGHVVFYRINKQPDQHAGSSSGGYQQAAVEAVAPSAPPAPPPAAAPAAQTPATSQNGGTAANAQGTYQGEPISMVNGEELLTLHDFKLPGPIPFAWSRTYRTSHSRNIGLGHGWTHPAQEQLQLEEDEVVLRSDEGREIRFARPHIGGKSLQLYENMSLTFLDHETFRLEQRGQPLKIFRLEGSKRFRLAQWQHKAFVAAAGGSYGKAAQGYALDFTYDEYGNLQRIKANWGRGLLLLRDKFTRIIAIHQTDSDHQPLQPALVRYEYDDHSDLVRVYDAEGHGEQYQYENHIITRRTLASGYNFYFEWDQLNNQARCSGQRGDNDNYAYTFKWDPDNQRSEATNSLGHTRHYKYNEFGLMIEELDAQGHLSKKEYNHAGRLVAETDPMGATTEYLYDDELRLLRIIDPTQSRIRLQYKDGELARVIDQADNSWQREYNAQGLLISQTDPNNATTSYHYDRNGMITSIVDAVGRVSAYTWNAHAELTSITDPLGNKLHYIHDEWGRIVKVIGQQPDQDYADAEQNATYYTYTATGRINTITKGQDVTTIDYNAMGQMIRHTDKYGRVTQYRYDDGLAQPTQRIDAAGNMIRYEYDTERNLIALYNENNERYQFFYDANERLIKEIGFDGRIQEYSYNAAGQIIAHQDAGEVHTEFERDAKGRLLHKKSHALAADTDMAGQQVKYRYDVLDRLSEAANEHRYLAFAYDPLGNIVQETQIDLAEDGQQSRQKNILQHQYNVFGQRLRSELPDGNVIDYSYDDSLELSEVCFNGQPITTIERDNLGREVKRAQGQVETCTDYDPQGRLARQHAQHQENKAQLILREYGYDEQDNLCAIKEGSEETRYLYDTLNRIQETQSDNPEFFAFDPAGNILAVAENDEAVAGLVKGNRLLMQADRKFLYDARGNLLKESRGKAGKLHKAYTYNLHNQLIKVETHDASQQVSFKYDPLGRRISKTDTFGTTHFLWADNVLLQEQRNNLKKTYIFEPGGYKPLALVQDDQVYHYHLDHLGTPRELTDAEGQLVWKARYKTYGNLALKEIDNIENNLRFQGQYFDEETGLHYNRFRYYNPDTGQFINQDPIGLAGGLNAYQYVDNPITWIDPLGLCKEYNPETMSPYGDNMTLGGVPLELNNDTKYQFVQPIQIFAGDYIQAMELGSVSGIPNNSMVHDIVAFRGTSSPPEVVFNRGFKAQGGNRDLRRYVEKNVSSDWVGTSKSPMAAARFGAEGAQRNISNNRGTVGYVYTVRVREGRDVNVELGHTHGFRHEQEVVTTIDGIPPEDILGAQPVDRTGLPVGDFIQNPNYQKPGLA